MISKDEMLALVRSVAVHDDVEQGMGHAFDLGVDWALAQFIRAVGIEVDEPQASNVINTAKKLTNDPTNCL